SYFDELALAPSDSAAASAMAARSAGSSTFSRRSRSDAGSSALGGEAAAGGALPVLEPAAKPRSFIWKRMPLTSRPMVRRRATISSDRNVSSLAQAADEA